MKSNLLDITCYEITRTPNAILVTDAVRDPETREFANKVWLPLSVVEVAELGYEPGKGSKVEVTLPATLAVEKDMELWADD